MARDQIRYRSGYKYQLADEYSVKVRVIPEQNIVTGPANRFINLDTEGVLVINGGYAWDGPSGPTIDTKNLCAGPWCTTRYTSSCASHSCRRTNGGMRRTSS